MELSISWIQGETARKSRHFTYIGIRSENIGEIIFQSSNKKSLPAPVRQGIWPQKGAKGQKNELLKFSPFSCAFCGNFPASTLSEFMRRTASAYER